MSYLKLCFFLSFVILFANCSDSVTQSEEEPEVTPLFAEITGDFDQQIDSSTSIDITATLQRNGQLYISFLVQEVSEENESVFESQIIFHSEGGLPKEGAYEVSNELSQDTYKALTAISKQHFISDSEIVEDYFEFESESGSIVIKSVFRTTIKGEFDITYDRLKGGRRTRLNGSSEITDEGSKEDALRIKGAFQIPIIYI